MNGKIDKLVEILELHAKDVRKPKEPTFDTNEMWKWLIIQICVRGGSQAIDSLVDRGQLDTFVSELSLDQMPLSYEEVLKLLNLWRRILRNL